MKWSSLEARPEEIEPPPDPGIRVVLAERTTAHEEEVRLLLLGLPRERPQTRPWRTLAVAVVVAGALLWALWPGPPTYTPPRLALDEEFRIHDVQPLGPSIEMHGVARGVLRQADLSGTVLELLEGSVFFDVDPEGPYRQLTVAAGDVTVRVVGTRFSVQRLGEHVKVEVERGVVSVRHGGVDRQVLAGESWTSPVLPVAPEHEPTPEPEPTPVEVPAAVAAPTAPPVAPPPRAPDAASVDLAALFDAADAGAPPNEILRLADAFLAVHADSPLAVEARILRVQAAVSQQPADEVLDEVDALLALPEASPRRAELLALRAVLAVRATPTPGEEP